MQEPRLGTNQPIVAACEGRCEALAEGVALGGAEDVADSIQACVPAAGAAGDTALPDPRERKEGNFGVLRRTKEEAG